MSGIFSEQAFVERLVLRVEDRFRYYPCWKKWLEKNKAGVWRDWLAAERLQQEYLLSLGPIDEKPAGRAAWSALNARTAMSQKCAMQLLALQPPLIGRAEELDVERPTLPPFPSLEESTPLASLPLGYADALHRKELEDWTLRVRVRVESWPNCLLRTDPDMADLGSLFSLLTEGLGPYVTRLPPQTWTQFPKALTPDVAWQLTGRHVCFLEGAENDAAWQQKFAQVALKRWLDWSEAEWTGMDGVRYTLRLPRFYIVTGPSYIHKLADGLGASVVPITTGKRGGR